jgi:hypothetical protein
MFYYYDCGNEEINIATTALIDRLTFNRITDIGFNNLTNFQKERVQLAAKAQCSYYEKNGIDNTVNEENIASIQVEDFHVSLNNSSEKSSNQSKPANTSSVCYNLLVETGLCCRAL